MDIKSTLANAASSAEIGIASLLPSGSLAPSSVDSLLRADVVETPVSDEESKIQQVCDLVNQIQQKNLQEHGKGLRPTHVKTRGLVKGELRIKEDLPDHLKQGIFAKPGKTYPLIGRYANEPNHIMDDRENAPRGLGVKVFDVEGNFMSGSEGHTQDLLFNNAPMLELTDLETCIEIFQLRVKYWDDQDALKQAYKKRSDATKQLAPGQLPNFHICAMPMYTQSAFAFGPYVAHLGLFPSDDQAQLSSPPISSNASPDAHLELLRSYFQSSSATYTLRVQLASNATQHSVEDASVVWPESTAPWLDLGVVTFPKQESWSEERLRWWEDKIALSPFNGLEAHRPLGSINRLRRRVYQVAREKRAEMNKEKVYFTSSIDEMPN